MELSGDIFNLCADPADRGANPAGEDLSILSATETLGGTYRKIVEAFRDPKMVDPREIQRGGAAVLRASWDYYGVWAVLWPLPGADGTGLRGVDVASRVCLTLLEDDVAWGAMYPALPGGLAKRRVVISKLSDSWNGLIEKASPGAGDLPLVTQLQNTMAALRDQFKTRFDMDLPAAGRMAERLRSLATKLDPVSDGNSRVVPQDAVEGASNASGPSSDTTRSGVFVKAEESQSAYAGASSSDLGGGGASGRSGLLATDCQPGADPVDRVERARALALSRVGADPRGAIEIMTATLESHGRVRDRFRARVYLGEIYLRAGHPKHARELLEQLDEEVNAGESSKAPGLRLELWEPELFGLLWASLHRAICAEGIATGAGAGGNTDKDRVKRLGELFTRVCRVDPRQALDLDSSEAK